MDRLAVELTKYKEVFNEFVKFMVHLYKINPAEYFKTVPNSMLIPLLIVFLEKRYNIDFFDALFYTRANKRDLNYNDTVKYAIKVVFHKLEHKQELDFLPF